MKIRMDNLSLGLEGAHSLSRIVHCGGDTTGKHVVDHLVSSLGKTLTLWKIILSTS